MRKILLVIIAVSLAVFAASLALTDHTNAGVVTGRPHLRQQTVDFDIGLLADSSAGWTRAGRNAWQYPEDTYKSHRTST